MMSAIHTCKVLNKYHFNYHFELYALMHHIVSYKLTDLREILLRSLCFQPMTICKQQKYITLY